MLVEKYRSVQTVVRLPFTDQSWQQTNKVMQQVFTASWRMKMLVEKYRSVQTVVQLPFTDQSWQQTNQVIQQVFTASWRMLMANEIQRRRLRQPSPFNMTWIVRISVSPFPPMATHWRSEDHTRPLRQSIHIQQSNLNETNIPPIAKRANKTPIMYDYEEQLDEWTEEEFSSYFNAADAPLGTLGTTWKIQVENAGIKPAIAERVLTTKPFPKTTINVNNYICTN